MFCMKQGLIIALVMEEGEGGIKGVLCDWGQLMRFWYLKEVPNENPLMNLGGRGRCGGLSENSKRR